MNKVQILTTKTCNYCVAAKNLLHKKNIAYQEIDLTTGDDYALTLLANSGQRTVPQIFINQHPIGGFTELSQLLADDELFAQRSIN